MAGRGAAAVCPAVGSCRATRVKGVGVRTRYGVSAPRSAIGCRITQLCLRYGYEPLTHDGDWPPPTLYRVLCSAVDELQHLGGLLAHEGAR